MSIDFSLVLVIATAVTGVVWGIWLVYLRQTGQSSVTAEDRRDAGEALSPNAIREPIYVEYARSFFPVLLIVLVVRSFLFEPFRIPSSSMMPTLLVGDFIFVNKFEYGLRLPVLNTEIVDFGEPKQGDVVVFRLPADPSVNYIKRLIGLPGDKITYRNKRLYVNNEPVSLEYLGLYETDLGAEVRIARESLGTVEHDILLMPYQQSMEGTFVVPEGHYFMMGDNRDNSRDSRYPGVGFIPADHVVGRAVRIWMNWDFPGSLQWRRIGMAIE
ncbi:MAG: signal peptidase I [Gammaproteobacteria bacterium]|jgi:signal peptidase I|tara:strand:+ start:266 stop:1078 length:813 start_codon:yes stop_codon:yes gene_type:complete